MLRSKGCEDLALPHTACGTLKNCPHASLAAASLVAGLDPCLDSTVELTPGGRSAVLHQPEGVWELVLPLIYQ